MRLAREVGPGLWTLVLIFRCDRLTVQMSSLQWNLDSCGELTKVGDMQQLSPFRNDSQWLTFYVLQLFLVLPLVSLSLCFGCRAAAGTVFEDDRLDKARYKLLWQWKFAAHISVSALTPKGLSGCENESLKYCYTFFLSQLRNTYNKWRI